MQFKERGSLHNIKVQSKAASADTEADTEVIQKNLAKIINEGDYTKQDFQCTQYTLLLEDAI